MGSADHSFRTKVLVKNSTSHHSLRLKAKVVSLMSGAHVVLSYAPSSREPPSLSFTLFCDKNKTLIIMTSLYWGLIPP